MLLLSVINGAAKDCAAPVLIYLFVYELKPVARILRTE